MTISYLVSPTIGMGRRDRAIIQTRSGLTVANPRRRRIKTNSRGKKPASLGASQSSKAKIIGLANAGGDTVNAIKQAAEFGIGKGGQKLAGMLVNISDIDALGLQTAQGLMLTEPWYWDSSDA